MAQRDRKRAETAGRLAEWLAITILFFKGYRILAHRQRTGSGELDIVCLKSQRVVIVEVKKRHTLEAGRASVSDRSWQRIGRAADLWLASRGELYHYERRYDLFLVAKGLTFCHILDAWRPDYPLTRG